MDVREYDVLINEKRVPYLKEIRNTGVDGCGLLLQSAKDQSDGSLSVSCGATAGRTCMASRVRCKKSFDWNL